MMRLRSVHVLSAVLSVGMLAGCVSSVDDPDASTFMVQEDDDGEGGEREDDTSDSQDRPNVDDDTPDPDGTPDLADQPDWDVAADEAAVQRVFDQARADFEISAEDGFRTFGELDWNDSTAQDIFRCSFPSEDMTFEEFSDQQGAIQVLWSNFVSEPRLEVDGVQLSNEGWRTYSADIRLRFDYEGTMELFPTARTFVAVNDDTAAWFPVCDGQGRVEPSVPNEGAVVPDSGELSALQQEAAELAVRYLDSSMSFSFAELVSQLEFEGFSEQDATAAVSSLNVDWTQQAVVAAQNALGASSYSREGLVETLIFVGHGPDDAEFAVSSVDVDWNEQAALRAQEYLAIDDLMDFDRETLFGQLVYDGFTEGQAEFGVNAAGL